LKISALGPISLNKSTTMNKVKYLGLSIGIFGCLFKLMTWAGASLLLIIGLSLLGIYYLIKVFENNSSKNN
jgi:hypothetical protein